MVLKMRRTPMTSGQPSRRRVEGLPLPFCLFVRRAKIVGQVAALALQNRILQGAESMP